MKRVELEKLIESWIAEARDIEVDPDEYGGSEEEYVEIEATVSTLYHCAAELKSILKGENE